MIVTCAWCHKQIIDDHDCPEKRAALESERKKSEPIPSLYNVVSIEIAGQE